MADPNRKGFFSSLGSVGGSSNSGFIFLHLKSPSERPEIPSADDDRASKGIWQRSRGGERASRN